MFITQFPQSGLLNGREAVIGLRFSVTKLAGILDWGARFAGRGSAEELWGQPGLTSQPGASKPPATLSMPHACALLSTYIQKALSTTGIKWYWYWYWVP